MVSTRSIMVARVEILLLDNHHTIFTSIPLESDAFDFDTHLFIKITFVLMALLIIRNRNLSAHIRQLYLLLIYTLSFF